LSVNVDHVATLREARGAPYPDPVEAARIAEDAGAGGVTVHLRGDRRHIQDHDVRRLRPAVRGTLNLEIAAENDRLDLALELRPDQVTLVPERPDEVTTEGGLDMVRRRGAIGAAAERLTGAGIRVSIFLDPDLVQLEAMAELDRRIVPGFEINTDAFTKATLGSDTDLIEHELDKVRRVAMRGQELGFRVYAGHGLTTANVGAVAAIAPIEELNIGHFLVSRAALVGLGEAVREMLSAMST
ncbi:MAG: pyridoxine 5'-phosphate synthase, partial [Acidobacteriota bacterium]